MNTGTNKMRRWRQAAAALAVLAGTVASSAYLAVTPAGASTPSTLSVTQSATLASNPNSVAIDSATGLVYTIAGNDVWVTNETGTIQFHIAVTLPRQVAVDSVTNELFVETEVSTTSTSWNLYEYNAATGAYIATLMSASTGGSFSDMAVDSTNGWLDTTGSNVDTFCYFNVSTSGNNGYGCSTEPESASLGPITIDPTTGLAWAEDSNPNGGYSAGIDVINESNGYDVSYLGISGTYSWDTGITVDPATNTVYAAHSQTICSFDGNVGHYSIQSCYTPTAATQTALDGMTFDNQNGELAVVWGGTTTSSFTYTTAQLTYMNPSTDAVVASTPASLAVGTSQYATNDLAVDSSTDVAFIAPDNGAGSTDYIVTSSSGGSGSGSGGGPATLSTQQTGNENLVLNSGALSIGSVTNGTISGTVAGTSSGDLPSALWSDTTGSGSGWNGTLALSSFIYTGAWQPQGTAPALSSNTAGAYTGASDGLLITVTVASGGTTSSTPYSYTDNGGTTVAVLGTATNGTPVTIEAGVTIDFAAGTAYPAGAQYLIQVGAQSTSALELDTAASGAGVTASSGVSSPAPTLRNNAVAVTGGGTGLGTAVVAVAANTNQGMGSYTVVPGASVIIDSNSWAATYTAQAQYTITTGP